MEKVRFKIETSSQRKEIDSLKKVCQKCIKNRRSLKCAGPYVLGPVIEMQTPKCITNCLGRKMGTSEFYLLKLLNLLNNRHKEDTNQGKILILTEFTILTTLRDEKGIPRVHGFFEELVKEDMPSIESQSFKLEKSVRDITFQTQPIRRVCLVLNCFVSHIYSDRDDYINLQNYVIKCNRLSEKEALIIFMDIAQVVQSFHSVSITL